MRRRWWTMALTVVAIGGLVGGGYWVWRGYRTFYISSGAMEPTLRVGDRVLCHKQRGGIERRQVVLFRPTDGGFVAPVGPSPRYIKRVLGFGGERIEIRDDVLYVDGQRIDEPYVGPDGAGADIEPYTVPAGQLYVLGDHRDRSGDSRLRGPVLRSDVTHVCTSVVWPLAHRGRTPGR